MSAVGLAIVALFLGFVSLGCAMNYEETKDDTDGVSGFFLLFAALACAFFAGRLVA